MVIDSGSMAKDAHAYFIVSCHQNDAWPHVGFRGKVFLYPRCVVMGWSQWVWGKETNRP